jgi:hypothetical protein
MGRREYYISDYISIVSEFNLSNKLENGRHLEFPNQKEYDKYKFIFYGVQL